MGLGPWEPHMCAESCSHMQEPSELLSPGLSFPICNTGDVALVTC